MYLLRYACTFKILFHISVKSVCLPVVKSKISFRILKYVLVLSAFSFFFSYYSSFSFFQIFFYIFHLKVHSIIHFFAFLFLVALKIFWRNTRLQILYTSIELIISPKWKWAFFISCIGKWNSKTKRKLAHQSVYLFFNFHFLPTIRLPILWSTYYSCDQFTNFTF